ncbi:ion transporter [Patescibacteria group bacterium]|nr:ion transporter [Patescibacteria group bacterium]MBU1500591.1 ion transporter [Patescibacteria group bacterium]MBU2080368.1 ion transporter [Patescibacteria group bacterium]MBU2124220.1 ion transporter [Patescibacteria group bacterium]MBU2194329.1 ion transporter [Patescibacteria group bacterium]
MKKKVSWITGIYNALERPRDPYFRLTNYTLGVVTVISVLAVILETVPEFFQYHSLFLIVEYVAVAIFLTEYLIRVYGSKSRAKYVFSFFGIIDFLAIVPTLLGFSNLTFLKAARTARVLRTLRTLRLLKIARFSDRKTGSQAVLGINFEIYVILLFTAIVILGTLLYTFESHGNASTIPEGMYWAFQVMIGDRQHPFPETSGGTVTMILVRFAALISFGLTIGIIGALVRKTLTGSAKDVE